MLRNGIIIINISLDYLKTVNTARCQRDIVTGVP